MENASIVDIVEVRSEAPGVNIAVIGVGGGGSHMISHLANTNPHKAVKLVAANTDMQDLYTANAKVKVILGQKLTGGLGAGMRPEVGEKAALETYEEIKAALSGSHIVFVSAGLGGGTGTGAAPVIAKAAKEVGALTISVVTKPFKREGNKRIKFAEEGLQNLKAESDCIVVIPNERLLSIIPPRLSYKESLEIVDDVLARAVNGMSNMILNHGPKDINVDFADAKTVMSYKGLALMGLGEARSDNAAVDAMREAIESPLLDNISIKGAKGVLVSFEFHEGHPLLGITEAMEIIHSAADEYADVIYGTHTRTDVDENYVRVTVIATGFEKEIVTSNNSQIQAKAVQEEGIQKINDTFRVVSPSFKEQHNLFDSELDVPSYMRNAMD